MIPRPLFAFAALLVAAAAASARSVDSVIPLNGTAAVEVPGGGRAAVVGVLVASGTSKGSIQVKAARGSLLVPRVSLVHPDGTVDDQDQLAALGAKLKATPKSVTLSKLPAFAASGLYKVQVSGAPDGSGRPTMGGCTVKLKGRAPTGFKAPPSNIAGTGEKEDYLLHAPENALLSVTLKPAKTTPFGVSLRILAASGDEVDFGPWSKVGLDDSITVKNMPLPVFGRYTLRVGSTAAGGDYAMTVKTRVAKRVPVEGAPVADAGGSFVVEPGATGVLDGSGTTGATAWLWVPVSGPVLSLSGNKVPSPSFSAPAVRATYAWQLVASNAAGPSLPSLAILEIDRAPVADAGPGGLAGAGAVPLDGTRSLDIDAGDALTYAWTQVSGPPAALDDPFAADPAFTPSGPGTYVFSLTVHDGIAPSEPSLVAWSRGGASSVADAGRPVLVRPQDSVFLSGLRSRRDDGGAPASWTWTAVPGNPAAVTLAGADGPVASFTAPKQAARLRFRLVVDGDSQAADEVLVVVTTGVPTNGSPLPDAGGPLAVATGAGFTLDGSGSTDDGTIRDFEWLQEEGPDAALDPTGDPDGDTVSGTAPGSDSVLRVLLMVHDGRKYGAPDAAMVVVGAPASATADAGPDLSGTPGAALSLSSAGSAPAPGQALTAWQWTQLSGKDWYDADAKDPGFDPTDGFPQVAVPTGVASLSPTRILLFGLRVTDATGASREDLVTLTFTNLPKNSPPAVDATVPVAVYRPGASVTLSAAASDADGDPIAYAWTQIGGPAVNLTNPSLANASLTAPMASATLTFRVTVSDGTGEPNGTAQDTVSFSVDRPPVIAVVSNPSSGSESTVVTLDGSGTADPDDPSPSFAWTEIPPAVGGTVTLSGASTATATFTQPAYTGTVAQRRRTFRLTVTDAMGPSFAATATVNFTPNRVPNAPAVTTPGDRKVYYSDSAASSDKSETMTASPATDLDGDPLTFVWSVKSGPITSAATLLSATGGTTVTFRSAPKPSANQNSTGGVYVIGVTASDGVALGAEGTVDFLVTSSWGSDVYPLLNNSCTAAACHGASQSGGLGLSGGASTARANLLNGRVAANDYENSLLYVKLSSGSMPQGGPPWTDTDTLKQMFLTNIVRDWIEPEWNASPKPGFSTGAESN